MKQKNKISFRLAAYTDAAGKFTSDAVRNGNEDNFFVDYDLTGITNNVAQDEIIQLGDYGMLMVVADGMGGMNAGEVASQIAVDTVKAAFKIRSIPDETISNALTRQKYLEQVIKNADKNIKAEARKDKSREGMGSTIIMAWLFGEELTISWCGDSRAYIFNEKSGIRLISQDHSYVQELVNKGLLTYEQTFDHPQNNIITRSLGDPTKDARPESRTLKVGKGDIILLCSDGLSGVLRDRKTYNANGQIFPEENLEDIIRANTESMKCCREALWEAAEKGGWYDNVTAILCQITDGPESQWASFPETHAASCTNGAKKRSLPSLFLGLLVVVAIVTAFFIGKGTRNDNGPIEVPTDSLNIEKLDSIPADSMVPQKEIVPPVNKRATEDDIKPTVQERIKKQTEEKSDTTSNGLTLINKGERKDTNSRQSRLTPIEDKLKQNTSDNTISPISPNKKDNNNDNPLNNQ